MRHFLGLFCAIVATLVAIGSSTQPSCNAERITCKPCEYKSDANFIGLLPRRDFNFKEVSSNWADYPFVVCEGDAGNKTCHLTDTLRSPNIQDMIKQHGPDKTVSYYQSIALYGAVAVAMALLCIFWVTCFVFWRYCTCCCCRASQRCKCGGKYPTRRSFCVGYSHQDGHRFGYSLRGRILALVYIVIFLGVMISFILVAEFKGNKALTQAFDKTATTTFDPVADMTYTVADPIKTAIVGVCAVTATDAIKSLNKTINDNVNIETVRQSLQCILEQVDGFPSIEAIQITVNLLENNVTKISQDLAYLHANLTLATAANVSLDASAAVGLTVVAGFSAQATNLTTAMAAFSNDLNSIANLQTMVTGPFGFETFAKGNLSNFQDNYPDSNDATVASGLLQNLIDGNLNDSSPASQTGLNDLALRLAAIQSDLQAMTSLPTLVSSLNNFNAQVSSLQTTALHNVFVGMNATKDAVAAMYSTQYINTTLNAMLDDFDGLNLAPVRASLVALNSGLGTLDYDTVRNHLLQIKNVSKIIPCLSNAIKEVLAVNSTLIELPDSISGIVELEGKLNSTLNPAIDQVDEAKASIDTAQITIESYNVTKYVADVDSAQAQLDNGRSQLYVNDIYAALQTMNTSLSFSYTSLDDVESLNQALTNSQIPTSVINSLNTVITFLNSLTTNVGTAVSLVQWLKQGNCDNTPLDYCTADGPDCVCSQIGVSRCENAPQKGCTADADCGTSGTGVRCLMDRTFFTGVKGLVDQISGNEVDVSDPISKMEDVEDSSSFDVAPLTAALTAADVALDAFNYSSMTNALNTLRSGLRSASFSTYADLVASVQPSIDAIDFSSVTDKLTEFNDTVVEFRMDKRSLVEKALNGTTTAQYFMNSRFHDYLELMSASNLEQKYATGGLSAMVTSLLTIPDDAVGIIINRTTFVSKSTQTTLVQDFVATKYAPLLDVLSMPSNEYRKHGSAFYFGRIYELLDSSFKMLAYNSAIRYSIAYDKDGKRYSGGRYCLTEDCIKQTVREIDTVSAISSPYMKSFLGTNVEFSSPINRERGFEILLVLPLIVVLLGLWGLTCAGFCCKNKPSWQKVPLSWMTGCIFVLMPFVFLFVGFFYIFVIFFGDACQSYGGLAVQLLQDDYLSACGNGAVGNNSVCFVNKTISIMTNADHDLSLEFSPGKMITSIIANCPDAVDPISSPFQQTAAQLRPIPRAEVDAYLVEKGNEGFLKMARSPLKDILRNASSSIGDVGASFIDDLATETLTCSNIAAIKSQFHNNLCCDVLSGFYWYIGAWYIMAWAMFWCGCCSGQLARKRLVRFPWGPHYDMDITEVPHMGTLEMVVSPTALVDGQALYGTEGTAPHSEVVMFPSEPYPGYAHSVDTGDGAKNPVANYPRADGPSDATIYPEKDIAYVDEVSGHRRGSQGYPTGYSYNDAGRY